MNKYISSLQTLRGIAFLLIFFGHAGVLANNAGGGGGKHSFLSFQDFFWYIVIVMRI